MKFNKLIILAMGASSIAILSSYASMTKTVFVDNFSNVDIVLDSISYFDDVAKTTNNDNFHNKSIIAPGDESAITMSNDSFTRGVGIKFQLYVKGRENEKHATASFEDPGIAHWLSTQSNTSTLTLQQWYHAGYGSGEGETYELNITHGISPSHPVPPPIVKCYKPTETAGLIISPIITQSVIPLPKGPLTCNSVINGVAIVCWNPVQYDKAYRVFDSTVTTDITNRVSLGHSADGQTQFLVDEVRNKGVDHYTYHIAAKCENGKSSPESLPINANKP